MKDVQATGEAFSPQHPTLQNIKFLHFLPSWIRIQPFKIDEDPDPQHWLDFQVSFDNQLIIFQELGRRTVRIESRYLYWTPKDWTKRSK